MRAHKTRGSLTGLARMLAGGETDSAKYTIISQSIHRSERSLILCVCLPGTSLMRCVGCSSLEVPWSCQKKEFP